MKNFFLLIFLSLSVPLASNAESYWLIIHDGYWGGFEKIKMKDMNQCELMGAKYKSSNVLPLVQPKEQVRRQNFVCLKGE